MAATIILLPLLAAGLVILAFWLVDQYSSYRARLDRLSPKGPEWGGE